VYDERAGLRCGKQVGPRLHFGFETQILFVFKVITVVSCLVGTAPVPPFCARVRWQRITRGQGNTSTPSPKFVKFNGELGFVNHLARIVTIELIKRSKPVHTGPGIKFGGMCSAGWGRYGQAY
jgi:hypothetical protein